MIEFVAWDGPDKPVMRIDCKSLCAHDAASTDKEHPAGQSGVPLAQQQKPQSNRWGKKLQSAHTA
jgi:hypothetical protein